MLKFLGARITDAFDLDGESEFLPSEWVIEVHRYCLFRDFSDPRGDDISFFVLRAELHANFDLLIVRELPTIYFLDGLRIEFSIPIRWVHGDREFFTDRVPA